MTLAHESLPRWEMSNVYSNLEGADYRAACGDLIDRLDKLEALFDQHGIGRQAPPADDASAAGLAVEVLGEVNALGRLQETLGSYVYAFLSTNSYDALAARETSKLELLDARRQKLDVRLRAWIGALGERIERLEQSRPELREHGFFLRHTARQSRYLMSEELESLAADLCIDGAVAFSKLHGNVTSQLKVPFDRGQGAELLPITVIRNLCFDPDPAVRERAYRAELKGWHSIRTPVAACLNAIKGAAATLARRRGRTSVLDAALDDNRIDRATLEALLGSIREALPTFRRYLRAKAARLGLARLRWWDLFAPLGAAHRTYSWPAARAFLLEKFSTFSDDLAEFTAAAFDRRWIDAAPRDGKRGGAFCMPVVGVDESRVLMNFDGSFEQVSTLAHELGHGYHNHCQRGLPPLLRGAPSTLAETASIFCETLVAEATLQDADRDEQLAILEAQLCGATQVCVDISSRFQFESAVFERRGESELSADEFCALMKAAQADTYGDAVVEETYHPYMWLWKPHYYYHTENFYNFAYAFGHLFGLGLYAIYRREGRDFVPRYRELLRATAQDYAAPLAARFGIDITKPEFWRGSLAIVAQQCQRFENL